MRSITNGRNRGVRQRDGHDFSRLPSIYLNGVGDPGVAATSPAVCFSACSTLPRALCSTSADHVATLLGTFRSHVSVAQFTSMDNKPGHAAGQKSQGDAR